MPSLTNKSILRYFISILTETFPLHCIYQTVHAGCHSHSPWLLFGSFLFNTKNKHNSYDDNFLTVPKITAVIVLMVMQSNDERCRFRSSKIMGQNSGSHFVWTPSGSTHQSHRMTSSCGMFFCRWGRDYRHCHVRRDEVLIQ